MVGGVAGGWVVYTRWTHRRKDNSHPRIEDFHMGWARVAQEAIKLLSVTASKTSELFLEISTYQLQT